MTAKLGKWKMAAVAAIVFAAAAILALWRCAPVDKPQNDRHAHAEGGEAASVTKGGQISEVENNGKPKPRLATHRTKPGAKDSHDEPEEEEDDLSPADRKLADAIEKALDDEDLSAARELSAKALASASVEVRQSMVDTLGWFGSKALPELTPFLADPDEDVRDSAQNEWSSAVSDIEDDGERLGVVGLAMCVLKDEDVLESLSSEYIGVDEKLAVESLLKIIEGDGSAEGIAKAKETYEFVTGDEFVDRAAAEKWLAEEYEPAP